MNDRQLPSIAGLCLLTVVSTQAAAHHGVAGLGAAGLKGPGAPVEAATSATLPEGSTLLYLKLDHARYETYDPDPRSPEADYANYWMAGAGYGFTPWLSGYLFLPYHSKVDEPGGYDTHGFADVSVFGQLGFKYDQGFRLNPPSESLDDLEDWHFTVFAGATLPTGNPNLRDDEGNIDPGKSTGFGEPSFIAGVTATKMLSPRWTVNAEVSGIWFQEHEYDDGAAPWSGPDSLVDAARAWRTWSGMDQTERQEVVGDWLRAWADAEGSRTRFGTETRVNLAAIYRAYTDLDRGLRVDAVLEAQYLGLGRDRTDGVYERATGGDMIYLMPGVRAYWGDLSVALGVKTPVWTDLNEESEQQGAEGREDYRVILSASVLF